MILEWEQKGCSGGEPRMGPGGGGGHVRDNFIMFLLSGIIFWETGLLPVTLNAS